MGTFTKTKIKKPKKIIKDILKGDLSLTKREFSLERTRETIHVASKGYKKIMVKVDELKVVHNRLFYKSLDE